MTYFILLEFYRGIRFARTSRIQFTAKGNYVTVNFLFISAELWYRLPHSHGFAIAKTPKSTFNIKSIQHKIAI